MIVDLTALPTDRQATVHNRLLALGVSVLWGAPEPVTPATPARKEPAP